METYSVPDFTKFNCLDYGEKLAIHLLASHGYRIKAVRLCRVLMGYIGKPVTLLEAKEYADYLGALPKDHPQFSY